MGNIGVWKVLRVLKILRRKISDWASVKIVVDSIVLGIGHDRASDGADLRFADGNGDHEMEDVPRGHIGHDIGGMTLEMADPPRKGKIAIQAAMGWICGHVANPNSILEQTHSPSYHMILIQDLQASHGIDRAVISAWVHSQRERFDVSRIGRVVQSLCTTGT